ncbi:hypothetical protein HYALB_00009925 [Hymenoscyphus albidus]|uniref:Golgi apparatus membrane protein TVP38 n=1 Tax=Hymenoscyphus albidus TaxID=595503 RepID=A0A9N9LJV1_9HELO|nr:hypothetical protein HYALB_00009925 [Hymenoscyphus albidus]
MANLALAMEMESPKNKKAGRPRVEEIEYEYKSIQWKNFFTKPKYIPWHILTIVLTVGLVLFSMHHDEIVEKITPIAENIRDIPGGFVIPVLILIAISFPPLFGHEVVALVCGIVWGLWVGFAIVAAGTFIGEIGTWYAFKYAFRRKAVKLERTNLNYGALARLTRDGGFWVVLIIRFSIVPSHFSTAVFSTCDVKFWHFAVATFLTLPKQIIIVYFGTLFVKQEPKNSLVNSIVLGIAFIATIIAGVYVYMKMRDTKKQLLVEQAERMRAKEDINISYGMDSTINMNRR